MADIADGAIDVIMALSSPPPPAPIAMIRLDGDGALNLFEECLIKHNSEESSAADEVCDSAAQQSHLNPFEVTPLKPREPLLVELDWRLGAPKVPAVALASAKGSSWTGNESVEILLPGSQPLVEGVLAQLDQGGARMATPGEFTRRSFMNGQMDLSRAESVLAVIEAEDRAALAAARRVLDGELAGQIRNLNDQLVDLLAYLEAGLDFSEQEVESPGADELQELLTPISCRLEELLDRRRWPSQGPDIPRVLLWGKPNAGKSTLFNALVGEALAITASTEGTTTDVIRGQIEEEGLCIDIFDLPGDRKAVGEVERIAIERAREFIGGDDRILWVFDGRRGESEWYSERDNLPQEVQLRMIPVWTHLDCSGVASNCPEGVNIVSAISSEGLCELRKSLVHRVRQTPGQLRGDALRFTRRQWHLLERCRESVQRSLVSAVAGPDLMVADLREAIQRLSEISGETTAEDVLDRIFARFCLGK
ncbi:MAG: hypothetical protein CBC13_08550 [Planctomycetia bacterium TMED53]|nr:MAG: hypothetical protein CBC13_08550 [Planctomycetia bacterium TMED53]